MSKPAATKPLFINTRPVERSKPLTCALMQAGMDVFELPLLHLCINHINEQVQNQQQRLIQHAYAALVVISPTAASLGIKQLSNMTRQTTVPLLANTAVVAVGAQTAKALPTQWQVQCPHTANNEGLLAMPALAKLQAGEQVLIWRGRGGRRLLDQTLKSRGVLLDAIAWYERLAPAQLPQQATCLSSKLAPNQQLWVLISSLQAFGYWQKTVIPLMNQSITYVCLGLRLQQHVAQHGYPTVHIPDLQPQTILAAIHK